MRSTIFSTTAYLVDATHPHRYAILVTDVPGEPFVPPYRPTTQPPPTTTVTSSPSGSQPSPAGPSGSRPSRWRGVSRLSSRAVGRSLSSQQAALFDEQRLLGPRALGNGRVQVEGRPVGRGHGALVGWLLRAWRVVFPDYGTVAGQLDELGEAEGAGIGGGDLGGDGEEEEGGAGAGDGEGEEGKEGAGGGEAEQREEEAREWRKAKAELHTHRPSGEQGDGGGAEGEAQVGLHVEGGAPGGSGANGTTPRHTPGSTPLAAAAAAAVLNPLSLFQRECGAVQLGSA